MGARPWTVVNPVGVRPLQSSPYEGYAVDRETNIALTTNPKLVFPGGMPIPADDPEVVHEAEIPPLLLGGDNPIEVFAVGFHMHLLGASGSVEIERADGSRECLLQIEDWNFDWKGSYRPAEPTIIDPDDRVHVSCTFDNSIDDHPFVDGQRVEPSYTEWGEGTTDEICLVPIMYATL